MPDHAHTPCSGCAYTKGSEANLEPQNHIKGLLCLLGGQVFYCHESMDWENTPTFNVPRSEIRSYKICEGWKREVRALAKTGYYQERPGVRRAMADIGMANLTIFCNSDEQEEKDEAISVLTRVLKKLGAMRRRFLK